MRDRLPRNHKRKSVCNENVIWKLNNHISSNIIIVIRAFLRRGNVTIEAIHKNVQTQKVCNRTTVIISYTLTSI